ncbi:hypothetical protein ASE94_16685 [Devosia sp. Leaf64]|nr:hypothetical protein ASE94_16685 [Devosia sp. Leaf64]
MDKKEESLGPPTLCRRALGYALAGRRTTIGAYRALGSRDQTFADSLLASILAGAANGLTLFTDALFRGLLKILPELHFAEDAFALKALLEDTKGLFDVVVAYLNLQKIS